MDNSNQQKIYQIISEELGVELEQITPEADFYQDFNIDKVSIADLFLAVENKFSIKLPKNELLNVKTVDDLLKLVEINNDEFV